MPTERRVSWPHVLMQRAASRTFLAVLSAVFIAEAITIGVAYLLLDRNANVWVAHRAAELVRVSEDAARRGDWSQSLDRVTDDPRSPLFGHLQDALERLNQYYFPRHEGSVYLCVLKRGHEYEIAANDLTPLDDNGTANRWELDAAARKATIFTTGSVTDEGGTYVASYTPVLRAGRVLGLVAAEYDEAPAAEFHAIIRSTFLWSIAPAMVISLVAAYVLAAFFAPRPTDIFRAVEETAVEQRALAAVDDVHDLWHKLAAREKEVGEHLRRGVERARDIAAAMNVEVSTVNTYLRRVKEKTGWSKQAFALQAAARRRAVSPDE